MGCARRREEESRVAAEAASPWQWLEEDCATTARVRSCVGQQWPFAAVIAEAAQLQSQWHEEEELCVHWYGQATWGVAVVKTGGSNGGRKRTEYCGCFRAQWCGPWTGGSNGGRNDYMFLMLANYWSLLMRKRYALSRYLQLSVALIQITIKSFWIDSIVIRIGIIYPTWGFVLNVSCLLFL